MSRVSIKDRPNIVGYSPQHFKYLPQIFNLEWKSVVCTHSTFKRSLPQKLHAILTKYALEPCGQQILSYFSHGLDPLLFFLVKIVII